MMAVPDPNHLFLELVRPVRVATALPFRVAFERLHVVGNRDRHVAHAHQHRNYEVMLIERGPYRCRLGSAEVVLERGGVVVIKPGDWHEDDCVKPVAFLSLAFQILPGPDGERSASLLVDGTPPRAQTFTTRTEAFFALARRIQEEGRRGDPFSTYLQDALCLEFVWEWLRATARAHIAPKVLAVVEQHGFSADLTALFERRLSGALGLGEMATALGLSERTLTARCRAAFNASPAKLFMRHKMAHARTLLIQTDLSIKAISAHLGFENPYHFSTVYKRVHGCAPSAQRT